MQIYTIFGQSPTNSEDDIKETVIKAQMIRKRYTVLDIIRNGNAFLNYTF
ncbi:MAG: hypothetical protein LBQ88_18325 [Treponema sp.]|nr:hypothetical protein [Treponema sp.]